MGLLKSWLLAIVIGCAGCATIKTVPPEQLATLEAQHTARFLFPSAGGMAEGYLARPRGAWRFPLMLFLHGHSWVGRGAVQLLNTAEAIAADGCFASLAISLPGYGATKSNGGPLDEQTRQVVRDAIAAAKQLPWVDASRLYLYGHSRGAVVAAAMINDVAGVEGAVLRSGAYDLPYLYQQTDRWWLKKLLNPKGEAHPKLYNLLDGVPAWKTSTLILHGEQDSIIPANQALRLRDRLQATGKSHRLVLYPERGHWLRLSETKEVTLEFLRERSGWSCPASDR